MKIIDRAVNMCYAVFDRMVNTLKRVHIMDRIEQNTEHSLIDALTADNGEYLHFLKLADDKQERILSAAYSEFIEKGYGEASTNVITKKAGISKGLLFHYFGNKEGLYKFLMKESARRIASEALPVLPNNSGDVFTTIESIVQLKISVCLRYPIETSFIISAWETHLPEGLLQERENMVDMSNNYRNTLIGLLDNSLLRDDVEKTVAAEIITWICEKYTDKILASGTLATAAENLDSIAKDLDRYMNALRHGLYK